MGQAHMAALHQIPAVEVVGIASRGGETAAKLATRYDVKRHGADWETLVQETRPDACVVAVSHMLTEEIVAAVIECGLHVLAEKPVALSSEAIEALAARAKAMNVLAMVGMNRRYYANITSAIESVKFYGQIMGVTLIAPDPVQRFRAMKKYDERVYNNWTRMNTLHAIDLLRLAGGEVASVCSQVAASPDSGERSIVSVVRFESGILGSFISHSACEGPWEMRIHGDGAETVLVPLEGSGTIRIGSSPVRPLMPSPEPLGLKKGLYRQAMAFVDGVSCLGRFSWPASDLADHAKTMRLVELLEHTTADSGLRGVGVAV